MRLILTLHHHQPIGQLPWTVSGAVRDCYAPLLKVLSRHPSIKTTLHYSGSLLEMLSAEHPIIIDQIKVLIRRHQIELLGGAWWEAILPIWPQQDQIAQLELSRERLKALFGCEAKTAWLPERVWEPQLAETLLQSSYKTTFIDDNGLKKAGAWEQELHRVNRTIGGLNVLSIDSQLRQLIPWRSVDEVLEYLRELHQKDALSIAAFADDAEKFGSWPGTFQLIHEERYLEDLLTAFEENSDWLQTVLPSDCDDSQPPSLEIPPTSYPEMLEWSGGNWRNFLERYHESRDMYETVLRAPRTAESLPHLLQAQCNDAYWHGVFGGLYLPHLRQAVYGAVAKAYAASADSKIETTSSGDAILKNTTQLLGFRPKGGQLFQWLDLQKHHNWLATLRRYEEEYSTEPQVADWYARSAGIEHFLNPDVSVECIATGTFAEQGDFVSETWQIETRQNEEELSATLTRQGGIWQQGNFLALEIKKVITLPMQGNHWNIQYEFTNPGEQTLKLEWGSEWNLSPSGSDFPERSFDVEEEQYSLQEMHVWQSVSNWQVTDQWLKAVVSFSADSYFNLWQMPFRTISRQEGETVETIFQQATIVMHRSISIEPGQKYLCTMEISNS